MIDEKLMRTEIRNYLEVADIKVLKMMHALLVINAEDNFWDNMPEQIKEDVEISLNESNKGKIIPHDTVRKRYQKWIAK